MPMPCVLVADDNPLSLRFFAEALAACGCTYATAADGVEAVAHAQAGAFDLLLFDARMPRLDGAAALAHLRARPGPSQHAPAVATTAAPDDAVHAALHAAGFAQVLLKPITIEALRAALAGHLPSVALAADAGGLDDAQALRAAGGDAAIVAALRGLLAAELDALPGELAAFGAQHDTAALRDRLHRLDASAGFCGVPLLTQAAARLRAALEASAWPDADIAAFLARCAQARMLLR
ncbi:MAG: response regulator [Rhodanobacteraceae bacterium]|jgi:CheY-like chemotaxis protein|nr:response regulator [Rhodanobacteraceae bacterium]